jgi:hypothetical protein
LTGVVVRDRVVAGGADAAAAGMRGSPTVLVDGDDVAAGPDGGSGPGSLACRLYPAGGGYEGAPPVEVIRAALVRAAKRGGADAERG